MLVVLRDFVIAANDRVWVIGHGRKYGTATAISVSHRAGQAATTPGEYWMRQTAFEPYDSPVPLLG